VVHVLQASGLDVVAVAANAGDVVRKARAYSPDVAVVDIQMPPNRGDDGLRAALEIRELNARIAVLILTQFLEERFAIALMGEHPEGTGYLLKDRVTDAQSFVDSVRRVSRGGSVVDAEVISRLVGRRARRHPTDELTPREQEVLSLMAQGKSNQGIADELVVTVSAVERNVTRIFSTLGLPRDARGHRRVLAVLRYLHDAQPGQA
jgi:DNA-binding NarL/FixJ family response regulator